MSRVERLAVSDRSRVDVLFRRQGALLGLTRSGHHGKPMVPDLEELPLPISTIWRLHVTARGVCHALYLG
jgi:hypothetical protein